MTTNSQTHTKTLTTTIEGVSFNTQVSVDTRGVVRLHVDMRNGYLLKKYVAGVKLEVKNFNRVIYALDTGDVKLYGTVPALFLPTKKSSTVVNRYGNFTFEGVSVPDPNSYLNDSEIVRLDKEIIALAGQIRRMKVLLDAQEEGQEDMQEQFTTLVNRLDSTKEERGKRYDEVQRVEKFKAVWLDVHHYARKS